MPDLKVYVNADPNAPKGKPKFYSARRSKACSELEEARLGVEAANRRAPNRSPPSAGVSGEAAVLVRPAQVREALPGPIDLARRQFTYIKSDATELPALYEVKDGKPALVNFQVHQGTYVVPKVVDDGYLALGKERFSFAQKGR